MSTKKQFSLSAVITSFFVGALVTYVMMDFNKGQFNQVNDSSTLRSAQPQKSRAYQRLRKRSQQARSNSSSSAFSSVSMGLGRGFSKDFSIEHREDDKFKYIDIIADGIDNQNLNVSIDDGMISLSGTIKKEVERNGSTFKRVSSFSRSFNVPEGVDEDKAEFETSDEKFTIKFPKRG